MRSRTRSTEAIVTALQVAVPSDFAATAATLGTDNQSLSRVFLFTRLLRYAYIFSSLLNALNSGESRSGCGLPI
ncbi:hypothetical protein BDZ89DRAFT_1076608 [Hymenopellis radicata]|nr:hypothetical protein BDZ89DRAFT_1076608 [Hymenopellis radicata]